MQTQFVQVLDESGFGSKGGRILASFDSFSAQFALLDEAEDVVVPDSLHVFPSVVTHDLLLLFESQLFPDLRELRVGEVEPVLGGEGLQVDEEVVVGEGVALEHLVRLQPKQNELVRLLYRLFVSIPAVDEEPLRGVLERLLLTVLRVPELLQHCRRQQQL